MQAFAVAVAVVGGDIFVRPLNDLVAQSHKNNIGRSLKVGTTFTK